MRAIFINGLRLTDGAGVVQPIVFLVVSILLIIFLYKKHTKWVWVSILPFVAMLIYQDRIVNEEIASQQESYAYSSWIEIYEPDVIIVEPTNRVLDEYDEWAIETEGGRYIVQFQKGQSKGYRLVDKEWETESLRGRHNVLDSLNMLNLSGQLSYHDEAYTLKTEDGDYMISLNENERVREIKDKESHILYENEEIEGTKK